MTLSLYSYAVVFMYVTEEERPTQPGVKQPFAHVKILGTGFFIDQGLAVTCNHVLNHKSYAIQGIEISRDFYLVSGEGAIIPVAKSQIVELERLDATVIEFKAPVPNATKLRSATTAPTVGQAITCSGYPSGDYKHNLTVDIIDGKYTLTSFALESHGFVSQGDVTRATHQSGTADAKVGGGKSIATNFTEITTNAIGVVGFSGGPIVATDSGEVVAMGRSAKPIVDDLCQPAFDDKGNLKRGAYAVRNICGVSTMDIMDAYSLLKTPNQAKSKRR